MPVLLRDLRMGSQRLEQVFVPLGGASNPRPHTRHVLHIP